jgi:hypothetical protein
VNEIIGEGLPNLLLRNVPPETSVPELELTQPAIYYGELTDEYVFVNSGTPEFDFPQGDANQFTQYQGKGGVALDSFFSKLLFSIRFGDGNVMLSPYITPETRVLFHRKIQDMVKLLAPFLLYDKDPYIVISEGKLYWIQDAYALTNRYPYSSPSSYTSQSFEFTEFNYIRNSVKVVIDAYEGTAVFYVTDPTDPIVQAYRGIFPALFKDFSTMPQGIRDHVRYPEELLNIQAHTYATFHMTDPQVFYTKEDVWTPALGQENDSTLPQEAYYTMMRLPGATSENFMLILPFTPRNRANMIAWMAGNSDSEDYGQVDVIRFPKQQLIYGPEQIEARIDQDEAISEQLTLWRGSGSDVIRGNLLTIPISNSVLYVEPLFLKATSGNSLPEMKRVIAVTGDRVGFAEDLDSALEAALTGISPPITDGGTSTPPPTPAPGQTPAPGGTPAIRNAAQLTQSALDHYERAQAALRDGDWTTYGREIEAMKRDLDALALVTGAATPVRLPTPATTLTPQP